MLLSACLEPERLDTVSVALTSFPQTLDPRITTDATGQRLNQLIFQSLVKFDRDLKIIPDASTGWEYNSKTHTYSFTLEEGLEFSNGSRVLCEDIVFSIQEFQKESSMFRGSFQIIQEVGCKDDIVQVSLKEFSATFLTDLTVLKILPKAIVEKYQDQFGEHIIGSGPYEIKKLDFNEIVLEKRKGAKQGIVPRFSFKIIQDDGTRFLNAYKGAIDIIPMGIPLNKISYLKEKNKYQILTYPAPSMNYLLINFKDPTLSKKNIRKAISHTVDVPEIIKYKMEGYGEPATTILPPANYFYNSNLKPIEKNWDLARKLWGETPEKEFVLKTSNNPEVIEIAKVLVEHFRSVGISLKTQSYEWGTFYGDIKKGQFQMAMMRWVGITDPDIYRLAFHSSEYPPGRNRGFYKNLKIEEALLEGTRIESLELRKKHYDRIQKELLEDLAIIPLWYNTQVDLVSHRVKGYKPALNGDFTPFLDISL